MKMIKRLSMVMLLLCLSAIMCGCDSKNGGSNISNSEDGGTSLGCDVTASEDKIVFVFPFTEDGGHAETVTVTATLLSGEETSAIYEFEERDGVFLLSTLDEGTYEIAASCAGYETDTRIIIVDDSSLYILRLELQSVQE